MKERIVSFPWMGHQNTLLVKKILESLNIKVVLPPKISEKTIKLGVRHSADMMCFPYKVTLGSFIEVLEQGANTLLMYDNCGQCRQRHYWKLQNLALKNLGYEFEFYPISRKTLLPVLKKLSNKSIFALFKAYRKFLKEIESLDNKRYQWSSEKPNIGIIGEIYTVCEEKINYDIELKLRKLGANAFNTARLSDFMQTNTKISFSSMFKLVNITGGDGGIFMEETPSKKKEYEKQAKQYLNGPVGGHGFENISNLFHMRDMNVDGIIHLLPLSCMPETTVEPIINHICQEAKIPLLRLPIDETNSEANVDTRVETFIELIKRKRRKHEMLARS